MTQTDSPILCVEITSFSFKAPLPPHLFSLEGARHGGGFVFDCRSLPNPGREDRLVSKTGLDADVCAYLEAAKEVTLFRQNSFALVEHAVQNFLDRGFSFMSVGFGCTGGQHRSVYFTERLSVYLTTTFACRVKTQVVHHSLSVKGLVPGVR